MLPEEQARVYIDQMFADAGWDIVNRDEFTGTHSAIAVREGLLKGNLEADYLLFLDGKAIGILEAKAKHIELDSIVAEQAEHYTRSLPSWCPSWYKQMPFSYLSNGRELLFKNLRNGDDSYIPISQIHTPRELATMANINSYYSGLPKLSSIGLRRCQFEAIANLEASFRSGHNRALMVLATGAGKTFTACMAAYRFLSYTPARRILFLVDRNNLGKQAEGEFGTFKLTENGEPFNTIFTTIRLKSATIPTDSNLVICTIQRIFSVLTGQQLEDSDDEESVYRDNENNETPIELSENLKLPKDYFDVIIIDECHRSIYGRWKQVLTYFDKAKLIGLTATPAPETEAFFNKNRVANYTLEKSIADGVNLDYRVYRIQTKVSAEGGVIKKNEQVKEITKHTGNIVTKREDDERLFTPSELNKTVVNPTQIRIILETYRDVIYTELYPDREPNMAYIPKTLIFAQSDAHATNIVEIAREVFAGQSNDFVQKITYSAGDSNELVRKFRNDKTFRIAVTVTLVATGTDIKPLEVVIFMRDVESDSLYTQMKGRGVRTVGDEVLRNVTPNAISKDLFYLVDTVGVTEHEKSVVPPSTELNPPHMTLKMLLEQISYGYLTDENLRLLASRLSRINMKSKPKQQNEFADLAGIQIRDIAVNIFNAFENNELEPFIDVNDTNLSRKSLVSSLANNPKARNYLLILNAGFVTILIPGEDEIIKKGFSVEEAQSTTQAFEKYVNEHKDELEALRIIYNNQGEPITYSMLKELEDKLSSTNRLFKTRSLWNYYSILNPKGVSVLKNPNEREALTNLIQLVRYAFKTSLELKSLTTMAASRFELWCGQIQRPLTDVQKGLVRTIVNYIASNGTYTRKDIADQDEALLAQMVKTFGSTLQLEEALVSLSRFILAA